jgi:hypothetical protein
MDKSKNYQNQPRTVAQLRSEVFQQEKQELGDTGKSEAAEQPMAARQFDEYAFDRHADESEPEGPGCLTLGLKKVFSPINFAISKIGCGCKSLVGLGCVVPLISFVLLILLILFQPSSIWEPFKGFLNQNLSSEGFSQIKSPEEQKENTPKETEDIEITEEQLAQALSTQYPALENFYLNISPNKITLLTNIDDQGSPLWLYIDIKHDPASQKLRFDKAGLGLFELPPGLINLADQKLNEALSTFNLDSADEILSQLVPIDLIDSGEEFDATQNITIELQEGKIVKQLK